MPYFTIHLLLYFIPTLFLQVQEGTAHFFLCLALVVPLHLCPLCRPPASAWTVEAMQLDKHKQSSWSWKVLTVHCPQCWTGAAFKNIIFFVARDSSFGIVYGSPETVESKKREKKSHTNEHSHLWTNKLCTLFHQMDFLALEWSSRRAFVWLALLLWV